MMSAQSQIQSVVQSYMRGHLPDSLARQISKEIASAAAGNDHTIIVGLRWMLLSLAISVVAGGAVGALLAVIVGVMQ